MSAGMTGGHIEVTAEGTGAAIGGGGSGGRFGGANAILNSPPGDVPVIDNVRPLDRKPFARSVTKFMKVSSALAADNCERERERAPVGRARTAERALGVYSYGYRRREHVPLVLHWSYGEGRSFA